ncbi:MAG: MaoC family dehydratase N-terminal domain-containing protein [Clostridia bacterium]|nr:MaoC family dehydratase N-terminal domain-containing protein [Clostridia bacterium]
MYFDELCPGMTVRFAPAAIEKEKMLAFAREYDNIPLHTDEEYAKTTPFGRLLAPGMLSFLEVWAKYLDADFFGEELLAGKSTKIEWRKPVFAGDVLSGRATVTDLTARNERNGLVQVTIDVTNQNGDLVLTSVTEAVVKRRTEG